MNPSQFTACNTHTHTHGATAHHYIKHVHLISTCIATATPHMYETNNRLFKHSGLFSLAVKGILPLWNTANEQMNTKLLNKQKKQHNRRRHTLSHSVTRNDLAMSKHCRNSPVQLGVSAQS